MKFYNFNVEVDALDKNGSIN